ncbi:cation:proton antiporter [Luteolibacter flavescens]|uniref:Cation:proton antiporter n=1 Tax=Luteolibacter flavescens TaxID=1859460 RepID=A0ABT3FJ20_9BACT|nr:cation:proton antiporter [Luteolibacter flavescens]MCW1883553.1 cation:proton antiporter [Luteolibacter flavescens]
MNRNIIFYLTVLIVVGGGILGIIKLGAGLPAPIHTESSLALEHARAATAAAAVPVATAAPTSAFGAMLASLTTNLSHPLSHLFIQLLVIIAASRVAGGLFTKMGQPAVVGEMMAGILLGPSLLGWLSPEMFQFVFPTSSLGTLKLLSQIGVCLFMFCVGMELDVKQVRNKAHTAVVVSHASIVAPYFLGVGLAYFVYSSLAQPGTNFTAFALFMGISMSITAFPVLARILQERGMSQTFLGNTAVTCAAVDDVTAWSALAFVVAIAGSTSVAGSALNLALVLVFIVAMIWGLRPMLPRIFGREELERPDPSKRTLAIVICSVLVAALCTEVVGIHALFGAFLAGAIMPDVAGFRHKLAVRVENFSTVLLLPLFFAFTGLRTQIGLLNDFSGWMICLAIIAVATAGKLGGTAFTARFTGMSWRDSLQLGALMNTRGLMELIALNIGYDLGILSPRIFAMLVIMALVTTAMTGPLLSLFQRMKVREEAPDRLVRP